MILSEINRSITREALISIIRKAKAEDDTCLGVRLVELLYTTDPNVEVAKLILGILQPGELGVFDAKALPPA